ncbi:MAG: DUF1566 domain-containing protein [Alphaproteobacteria bacterium]|nr:DUF1566 domain-containing protein [Alphaproteobacteria bacterium]
MQTKEKINITQVKPGMLWYKGDIFSFEKIEGKEVKAIVELVEDGVIYGDLTASEMFDIREEMLNWGNAKNFIDNFYYPSQRGEAVVWYSIEQLEKVCKNYELVKKAFREIKKPFRKEFYWSSTERSSTSAWYLFFENRFVHTNVKYDKFFVRPVLTLTVK